MDAIRMGSNTKFAERTNSKVSSPVLVSWNVLIATFTEWKFVLWTSCEFRREANPSLPEQGKSFFQGVRFSVQTFSLGRVEYLMKLFPLFGAVKESS